MVEVTAKFSIGQKVASKKTGYPGVGTICAIATPIVFVRGLRDHAVRSFNTWLTLYPDCQEKCLYMVSFKEPRYVENEEEFAANANFPDNPLYKECMLISREVSNLIYYPEDDLELYE